jgi:hypothetical protein
VSPRRACGILGSLWSLTGLEEMELTGVLCRNGSVESIKKIIKYLNEAKLDPNVGT